MRSRSSITKLFWECECCRVTSGLEKFLSVYLACINQLIPNLVLTIVKLLTNICVSLFSSFVPSRNSWYYFYSLVIDLHLICLTFRKAIINPSFRCQQRFNFWYLCLLKNEMTLGCLSHFRCICEAKLIERLGLGYSICWSGESLLGWFQSHWFEHDIPQYVLQSYVENKGRDFRLQMKICLLFNACCLLDGYGLKFSLEVWDFPDTIFVRH